MDQASCQMDFTHLGDPEFLEERSRVRELLDHMPEHGKDRAELLTLYARLTAEFDRRAGRAWAAATRHPAMRL
jgi:hypothetical protein